MSRTSHDRRVQLLHGTLDMLILRILEEGPQHGRGIGRTLRAQSNDLLDVRTGSLYPALHRLENRGYIEPSRHQGARSGTKSYRLTPAGEAQLLDDHARWRERVEAIGRIMNPAPNRTG